MNQIVETHHFFIHITETEKELKIYVNRKVAGKEELPNGYVLGSSALIREIKR